MYEHNLTIWILFRIIEYGNKKEKSSPKILRMVLRTKYKYKIAIISIKNRIFAPNNLHSVC